MTCPEKQTEPVRTPSLASWKRGVEPPSNAGGSQLADHRPETTSFERSSVEDPSIASSIEDASSSENAKQQSFAARLKRALHLQDRLSKENAEYSYDYKLEQTVPKLDQYPVGYGKLAAFGNCDPDFLIYRKFGWLRNRALLFLQDELVQLEDDLEALDSYEFIEAPRRLFSCRQNGGPDGLERRDLHKKIKEKLAEYDESLLRMQKIQAIRRPSKRSQKSVANFIYNTGSQAVEESDWIRIGPDLAAVAHDQEHGWLIGFIEDTLMRISKNGAMAILRSPEQKVVTGQEPIVLLSAARLDILLRSVVTISASVVLLAPIFILFKLQPRKRADVERNTYCQILIIFIFTLGFSALCSIFTKAKRQEVFAATAAYAAVLTVFLGNSGSLVMTSPA